MSMTQDIVVVVIAAAAIAAAVMAVRFVSFCLADLAQATEVRYLTPQGWTVLIVLAIPLGGMLYLNYGKVR